MISLNKIDLNVLLSIIDNLFDRTKFRLLGPYSSDLGDKRLNVRFVPHLSLPGLFTSAALETGDTPNVDLLNTAISVTNNYIDKYKNDARARVSRAVEGWMQAAGNMDSEEEAIKYLQNEVKSVFDSVTPNLISVAKTESSNAQNMSKLDTIVKVNAKMGIEDPIMFFICKFINEYPCPKCRELHLLDDGITPKLWLLSELKTGYAKKGDTVPSVLGQHPNCNCVLSALSPGSGFNEKGKVTYINVENDEFKKQRGIK